MGRYLHEFRVGERFETHGRTITETDIYMFAQFTGDWNPVHVDDLVATPLFGGRIAHGPMFPGIAFGLLSRFDLIDGTAIALKDMEWEFLAPVHISDTIRVAAEVTEISPHPVKADRGRLALALEVVNQDQTCVNRGRVTLVMQTGQ